MGISATQGRLLFMTARISDNEFQQQTLVYSKQRLADGTEQINDAYLAALEKTKFQVLTGYNGNEARYEDVSFAQMTGLSSVATGKQYLVTNNQGKVLVDHQLAKYYTESNGDYNKFLAKLGLKQSNINHSDYNGSKKAIHDAWDRYLVSVNQGIATSADKNSPITDDKEGHHMLDFGYTYFSKDGVFDGYPTYEIASGNISFVNNTSTGAKTDIPINFFRGIDEDKTPYYYTTRTECYPAVIDMDEEGNDIYGVFFNLLNSDTPQYCGDDVSYNPKTGMYTWKDLNGEEKTTNTLFAREQFGSDINSEDGILSISISENREDRIEYNKTTGEFVTESGNRGENFFAHELALNFEGATQEQRDLYDYAMAITAEYVNPNAMADLNYDAQKLSYYKNIFNEMTSKGFITTSELKTNDSDLKDPEWFVKQLKNGNLKLSYYSKTDKAFIGTSLSDDESIVEKEDKTKIAIEEQKYKNALDEIERQENMIDTRLNKLDTEHKAMVKEYEALNSLLKENSQKQFNTFNS